MSGELQTSFSRSCIGESDPGSTFAGCVAELEATSTAATQKKKSTFCLRPLVYHHGDSQGQILVCHSAFFFLFYPATVSKGQKREYLTCPTAADPIRGLSRCLTNFWTVLQWVLLRHVGSTSIAGRPKPHKYHVLAARIYTGSSASLSSVPTLRVTLWHSVRKRSIGCV